MKNIKAVLLDLGNVVVRFDPDITEKGYAASGKIRQGAFSEYIMDSENANRYMEGELTSSQFYTRTCRMFKINLKYNEFYEIWNSMFFPYPEMERLVGSLKEKYPDIKLVLVSNTNETHYDFLKEKYKVLDLFDARVVSHEFGKQKPAPEIYTEALRHSGTIPRETFYADDRPELIDAARVMGIRAFQFTGADALRDQLAKFGIKL